MELKGLSPSDGYFDICWDKARKQIENQPGLCVVPDLESGLPIIMTVEERQDMINLWESCKPKTINKDSGKLFVYGTGGCMDEDANDYKNLFYNSENE